MKKFLMAATVLAGFAGAALAADPSSPSDLGKSLTPFGAIRAGNRAGTIPAWTGGITAPPAGWHEGMARTDMFPSERPLFSINAQNLGKYEAHLAAGTAAMLRTLDGFRIDIYPTHRTAAAPQYIYDATIQNATRAHLVNDGQDVEGAQFGSPFPIPHNGNEAIWNHILRWRGLQVVRYVNTAITTPTGDYSMQRWYEKIFFPYATQGLENDKKWDSMYWQEVLAPPRIAGLITMAVSFQNPQEQPRTAWQYYPGERRVRRAPEVSYDTPYNNADGLATVDDYDLFNGALDRYTWRLVGRREIYVPYNTGKFQDPSLKYSDILKKEYVNPDIVRWELHRCWVVEATLKPDQSHIYAKRMMYLDEDSWQALISDRYDRRGALWRTGMSMSQETADVPVMVADGYQLVDLYQHRYIVQGMHNEERVQPIQSGNTLSARDFTAEAMRRFGRR